MTNNMHTIALAGLLTNLFSASIGSPGFSVNMTRPVQNSTAILSSNIINFQQDENPLTSTFNLNISDFNVNRIIQPKKSYKARYKKISNSKYFRVAYDNKSIGEIMHIES